MLIHPKTLGQLALLLLLVSLADYCLAKDLVRPPEVKSRREINYSQDTYDELAKLWHEYHETYPSEYSYANWMYAKKYSSDFDFDKYQSLLEKGIADFPANPTLQYLLGNQLMVQHDASYHTDALEYLLRARELDSAYIDPLFSLVVKHMASAEFEKLDANLTRILENGGISDVVMDYNYNMLACLKENAILISNGDNDTFPGWVLTRILDHRPDVRIVNLSLLNTEWYALQLQEQGLPEFVPESLPDHDGKSTRGIKLLMHLIAAAAKEKIPLYFAVTLNEFPQLEKYFKAARLYGLALLITPEPGEYVDNLRDTIDCWLDTYKTAGMDSWQLRYGNPYAAGRNLCRNYLAGMTSLVDTLAEEDVNKKLVLFNWYKNHLAPLTDEPLREQLQQFWENELEPNQDSKAH
jgi:hypothetical protein